MDDQQRFLAQFLRHQEDLRAFVGSVVRDWTAVDDILQETSSVLWRKFAEYDATRSFGAWARGIAVLEIRKHQDRQRRLPLRLSEEAVAALDHAWEAAPEESSARLEALARCLERVDPRARELLTLRYRDGLEITDLAGRSGRGVEAVGKALQRLREALGSCVRRQLGTHGP